MDYLRSLYEDELNSDGVVEIAGSEFHRSRILSEIEPETYDIDFEDWKRLRKIELLKSAEEILDLYDNRGRFEQLVKSFARGKIIPFVGAGMSMPSDYPSWTKFLFDACDESHVTEEDLDLKLKEEDYEGAAQMLHDDMTPAVFNELLESTFKSDRDILGAVNYLPEMFPECSVITTNFDEVIEKLY